MRKSLSYRYDGWCQEMHGSVAYYDPDAPQFAGGFYSMRQDRDEMRRARKAARQTGVTPPKPAITPRASGRTV